MTSPEHVLVATTGRPFENRALAYALETFPEARVTLLAVVTPLDSRLSEGAVLERDEERRSAARDRASELADGVCETVGVSRDRVRVEVAAGRPGTVVPRYATDADVDHVVCYGTESDGFIRRFLGRDVATTVVDRTPLPVTVLTPGEEADAD